MFFVLQLPDFPLQAITRLEADPPIGPAVATEATGQQSRVIAANAAARDALIHLGMTTAQARARVPTVALFSRRQSAEAGAMDLVFALLYRHTPKIERTAPGLFTGDLTGSAIDATSGAATAAFAHDLLQGLHAHGLEGRCGFAPLPDLARFAAAATTRERPFHRVALTDQALATVPFSATGCTPELRAILRQMGLRHLGEFLRLPRAEVARRLGPEALALWEAASGAHLRLLRIEPPPRHFRVSQELDYRVHTLEPLLFLIHRLLEQLEAQLRAATQYASHLSITLALDHAEPYLRRFQLPEPSQRGELLGRILHLHLEQLRTAEAIVGLTLEVDPVDPPHRQRGLFHTTLKDPWRFADTQAQLIGLLGNDAVGRPRLLDTHKPDSFSLEPILEEVPPLDERAREAAESRPGPALRRYRPALPARVRLRQQRPIHLDHPQHRGPIRAAHGPFPLSGQWWERPSAWHLTEWDIELTEGPALRLRQTNGQWFIEGIYD